MTTDPSPAPLWDRPLRWRSNQLPPNYGPKPLWWDGGIWYRCLCWLIMMPRIDTWHLIITSFLSIISLLLLSQEVINLLSQKRTRWWMWHIFDLVRRMLSKDFLDPQILYHWFLDHGSHVIKIHNQSIGRASLKYAFNRWAVLSKCAFGLIGCASPKCIFGPRATRYCILSIRSFGYSTWVDSFCHLVMIDIYYRLLWSCSVHRLFDSSDRGYDVRPLCLMGCYNVIAYMHQPCLDHAHHFGHSVEFGQIIILWFSRFNQ